MELPIGIDDFKASNLFMNIFDPIFFLMQTTIIQKV